MTACPSTALPASAAWLHREARSGFEVSYFRPVDGGLPPQRLHDRPRGRAKPGSSSTRSGSTRSGARGTRGCAADRATGVHTAELEADGAGSWSVNGRHETQPGRLPGRRPGVVRVDQHPARASARPPAGRAGRGARRLRPRAGPRRTATRSDLQQDRDRRRAPGRAPGQRYQNAAPSSTSPATSATTSPAWC